MEEGKVYKVTIRNYPGNVCAMYNGAISQWVASIPQCGLYEGKWNDWYFENEYFNEDEVTIIEPL